MGSVVVLREEVAPKRRTPRRRPNAELRTREHLTEREVEKLIEAAKGNRWGHRDGTMILICKNWYSTLRTVSDHRAHRGHTNDRSVRAFAVKPRAFGAPLCGFGA